MGMFDVLVCDIPLPHPHAADDCWQTKSIANGLHHYRITIDGRLVVDEWSDPEDIGEYPRIDPRDVNGDVVFYGSPADDDDVWVEYRARLRRGMVEYIDLVEGPRLKYFEMPQVKNVRVWPPGGGRVR